MGFSVKISGPGIPTNLWDLQASRALALVAAGAVSKRTSDGRDVEDKAFAPYKSTGVMYVQKNGRMARRLSPKGGEPTRGGKSVKYRRNYYQYRVDSGASGRVNLTLSGQLLRSVGALRVSREQIVIGVRGEAAIYGAHLQVAHKGRPARRWFGLSNTDKAVIGRSAQAIMADAVARHRRLVS